MLENLESNFKSIEQRVLKLSDNYRSISHKYEELLNKYNTMKTKYSEIIAKNVELEDEKKRIKLSAAVLGNPEYSRLMKSRINRLVKEIDTCIYQLQNTKM